jgi:hypothetical protein
MHLPEYDAGSRRRSDGVASVREDVHVHAGAPEVRALLADPPAYRAWLPEAIRDFVADSEGLAFTMVLPGRTESVSLRRVNDSEPRSIVYRLDQGGAVQTLTWSLFPEGQHECHVTIDVSYHPARGFLGGAMETMVHRGQRIQILRDLLWRLKASIEGATIEGTNLGARDDAFDDRYSSAHADEVAGA